MKTMTELATEGRAEAARLSGRPDYRATVDLLDAMADALDAAVEDILRSGEVINMLKVAELRAKVAAGATHDCGEWVKDGKCELCDRPMRKS